MWELLEEGLLPYELTLFFSSFIPFLCFYAGWTFQFPANIFRLNLYIFEVHTHKLICAWSTLYLLPPPSWFDFRAFSPSLSLFRSEKTKLGFFTSKMMSITLVNHLIKGIKSSRSNTSRPTSEKSNQLGLGYHRVDAEMQGDHSHRSI